MSSRWEPLTASDLRTAASPDVLRARRRSILSQARRVLRLRSGCVPDLSNLMQLRCATLEDIPQLHSLIAASIRALGADDYRSEQIEGALKGAFGVDTQLIRDGTYFVVEIDGRTAACGGWSKRKTLFGGDARAERDAAELDPTRDAAKIRAFFVHPDFARRGIGRLLLDRCEQAAIVGGFTRFEMMATLPGVRLYEACGYVPAARIDYPVGEGVTIEFVPMSKSLADHGQRATGDGKNETT
jgi:GNAT superfamily N-acetyltransferase